MIKIGKIVNTKGLLGEIKLLSSSDFKEERFKKGNKLHIQYKNELIEVTIKKWTTVKSFDILKFEEFNKIEEVEKFKNSFLVGEKIDERNLEDGEYFINELDDFKVYYKDKYLGYVLQIEDNASKSYLRIKRDEGRDVLIPLIDVFIKKVDKENSRIDINEMDGLIDD